MLVLLYCEILDVLQLNFNILIYDTLTIFVSGTLNLFNVMCKQHHRTALVNPFLNGTKTVTLTVRVNIDHKTTRVSNYLMINGP